MPRARPGRPRTLAAALALPVVGLAALALAVALTHRSSPQPVVDRVPLPPVTALPSPPSFPPLFAAPDDFSLGASRAFGSIAVPSAAIPSGYTFDVVLAGAPAGLPTALPVWRLTPAPFDPRAVAARFGLGGTPDSTPLNGAVAQWSAGLTVDSGQTIISWTPLRDSASPPLGGRPRDSTTAATLATRWLDRTGLGPPAGVNATVEQTSNGQGAAFAEWAITWPRAAPQYPTLALDSTVARVSADGTLKELELRRPVVRGGALYPLRSWQDALAAARQGDWLRAPAPLPDFSTPGVLQMTVSISITYSEGGAAQGDFAVPVYAFTEDGNTAGAGLVSALAT